jgi:MarR family transcriptional regulator, temperature-dependent positive regulator of motility
MIEQTPFEPAMQDAHLRLLSLIEQHPEYSQRRLAEAMGVSLGKAHYLLKALFEKGLVKAGKFSRNPVQLRYVYALTPAGVKHRVQLARRFLQVKEQEFVSLKSEIERLRAVVEAEDVNSQSGNASL